MYGKIRDELTKDLEELHTEGTYKDERVIVTPQGATIRVSDGAEVLNFCANNYLGLANDPSIREAAVKAMEEFGYGLSSVRFICGTQVQHKKTRAENSRFSWHGRFNSLFILLRCEWSRF